jgi:hypothetical protein
MTLRQCNNPSNRKVQTHRDRKRQDRWRAESRVCSSFSSTSRGLFTKNSSWQAKQWILHATVTFYGDCVKMCKEFALNFGDKRIGCCIMATHRLTLPFSPGNYWPKTPWLSSPTHPTHLTWPPATFLFPPTEDKTERLLFWHNWDDRGRIAGGANTLTEHDFRMHLKNRRSAGNSAYVQKGTTSRVMVASGPKVSFCPDGSTSPGNYGYHLVPYVCKYQIYVAKYLNIIPDAILNMIQA